MAEASGLRTSPASVALPGLAVVLAILATGLSVKSLGLPVEQVWRAVVDTRVDVPGLIAWQVALPRIVIAWIVGAGLALAGVLLQQSLRNPLADTTTLGIASGAYLALAATSLFASSWLDAGSEWIALAGGGAAAAFVLGLTWTSRSAGAPLSPVTLILAGLTVNLFCGAAGAALTILNHDQLSTLFIWQTGSLVQNGWQNVQRLAIPLALCLAAAAVLVRPLAMLDLDDAQAASLGVPVGLVRAGAVALAVAAGALCISAVGVIGFLGIAAGQIATQLGARTMRQRIVWAPALGALLLWTTDQIVQHLPLLAAPIPTGSAAALLGAPLLLLLMGRQIGVTRPTAAIRALHRARHPKAVTLLMAGTGTLCVALALLLGKTTGGWHWLSADTAWEVLPWRLPRVTAAAAAGTMLAVAGILLQRMTGNPMASPEVLGVSSGAALAIVLLLMITPGFTQGTMAIAAIAGATLTLAILVAITWRLSFSSERLLLAGVALATVFSAFAAVLLTSGDPRAAVLLAWMAGSTYRVSASDAAMACTAAVLLTAMAPLTARWLAILPLGVSVARSLGVPVTASRLVILVLAAVMTAMATLTVGPLSFAGLLAPHLVRAIGVESPHQQIAAAAAVGASIMVIADWLGRVLLFPWQVPAGLLASLAGAPLLLWMLRRSR